MGKQQVAATHCGLKAHYKSRIWKVKLGKAAITLLDTKAKIILKNVKL